MSGFFGDGPDPASFCVGLLVGVILVIGSYILVADEARESCRDDRNVEQLCIDGNDSACRVMEVRRGRR